MVGVGQNFTQPLRAVSCQSENFVELRLITVELSLTSLFFQNWSPNFGNGADSVDGGSSSNSGSGTISQGDFDGDRLKRSKSPCAKVDQIEDVRRAGPSVCSLACRNGSADNMAVATRGESSQRISGPVITGLPADIREPGSESLLAPNDEF